MERIYFIGEQSPLMPLYNYGAYVLGEKGYKTFDEAADVIEEFAKRRYPYPKYDMWWDFNMLNIKLNATEEYVARYAVLDLKVQ